MREGPGGRRSRQAEADRRRHSRRRAERTASPEGPDPEGRRRRPKGARPKCYYCNTKKQKMMRKISILWAFLVATAGWSFSFTENFDSYDSGDYITAVSSQFVKWSPSAADALVTNEQFYSDSNSLKLQSSSTSGGPTDVVLKFENSSWYAGHVQMKMKFYVASGSGAYYNFQGAPQWGQSFPISVFFLSTGQVRIASPAGMEYMGSYTQGQWFTMAWDIDLTLNVWKVYIDPNNSSDPFTDANLLASFSNPDNQLAGMDLYPLEPNTGNSLYYLDDIEITHTPHQPKNLDAAIIGMEFPGETLKGTQWPLTFTLRNVGTTPIQSARVAWTYGNQSDTVEFTGLNMNYLAVKALEFSQWLTVTGNGPVTLTVVDVNGGADDDATNNTYLHSMVAYDAAADKKVLVEEATGTWCSWCVRGIVMMDRAAVHYDSFFVGVAVHSGDPMEYTPHKRFIAQQISGYPSVVVERDYVGDPLDVEDQLVQRAQVAPTARVWVEDALYDMENGELTVTVKTEFLQNMSGPKLLVVVYEDSVTGTGSGYAQANAYAGGVRGPMGGFENLPNPVPASRMKYDMVSRYVFGSVTGVDSFGGSGTAGQTVTTTFTLTDTAMLSAWRAHQLHVAVAVIKSDGKVDNANKKAVRVMYPTGMADVKDGVSMMNMVPNPYAGGEAFVEINLTDPQPLVLSVYDVAGKRVMRRRYSRTRGHVFLPVRAEALPAGLYTVELVGGKGYRRTVRWMVR